MSHEDLAILGLNPEATEQEIAKAYRRLAAQYHPDKNPAPEAIEQFQKIKTAYENLTRPKTSLEIAEHIPPLPRTWQNTAKRAKEFLKCAEEKNDATAVTHWQAILDTAEAALAALAIQADAQDTGPDKPDFGGIQFEEYRRDFARDVVIINRDATRPYLAWLTNRKENATASDLVYFHDPYFKRCILIAECMASTITTDTLTRIKSIAEEYEPIQTEELSVLFLLALRTNNLILIEFFLKELHININNLVTVSDEANDFKRFFLISPLCFAILDDVRIETIVLLLDNGADPNLAMKHPNVLFCIKAIPPLLLAVKTPSSKSSDNLTDCEYPEKDRQIDSVVATLLKHGADASALSLVQKSFCKNNYLYFSSGTKYYFNNHLVLKPFYSYLHVYSRILLEALHGLEKTTENYTDISHNHGPITTEEANSYFEQRQQQAIQYLSSIRQLLAHDYRLTITIAKDKITAGSILDLRYLPIIPFSRTLKDPRSKREQKLAKDSRKQCNALLRCRMAFDQSIALMSAGNPQFKKYLAQALKHNNTLFHDLIVNLLTQKGAYLEFNLASMPEIAQQVCDLDIVRNTAKTEALALLAKIPKPEDPAYNTQTIRTYSPEEEARKKTLLANYETAIRARQEQIKSLAILTARTEEIQCQKTTRISNWDSSSWTLLRIKDHDTKEFFAMIENNINHMSQAKFMLSPYQPVSKNMEFFNRYLLEAITGKKAHSFNRVVYCISFITSMDFHYNPNQKDLATIELLKNLYALKGLLLAEAHAQSYLRNLFHCAMTSRLADHVLTEIHAIEALLRKTRQFADKRKQQGDTDINISPIDIDSDPEILAKRNALAVLDKHYGTAWQRFKTALFTNKQALNQSIDQEIIAKREQCFSLVNPYTLFAPATTSNQILENQHRPNTSNSM